MTNLSDLDRPALEARLAYHQRQAALRTGGMKTYHNQKIREVCALLTAH